MVCVASTIAIFLFFFGYTDHMVIRSEETNKPLFTQVVEPNMTIKFSYIHSVSVSPIEEFLEVTSEGYILRKVVYIDQGGAGMPEFAFGDQEFVIDDNKFVIQGFDRFFESIVINVQKKYEDKITLADNEIDLYKLLNKNGRVILDVEKMFYKKAR